MGELAKGNRKLLGCFVALVAVILLVFVAVPYGVRQFVRSRLSPAQVAFLEKAYKPPQVPASWAEVTPASPALDRTVKTVSLAWERRSHHGSTVSSAATGTTPALWRQRDLEVIRTVSRSTSQPNAATPQDWMTAIDLVAEDAAFIDALLELARAQDFEVNQLTDPFFDEGRISYLALVTGVKLALMRARIEARDGDISRGLGTATAVLRLARCHPASNLGHRLMSIAINEMATAAMADIGAACQDRRALLAALGEMRETDSNANASIAEDMQLAEVVGSLRALKREGYPVDLNLSRPATFLLDQRDDAVAHYPDWKTAQLEADDPLRAKYETYSAEAGWKPPQASIPHVMRWAGGVGGALYEIRLFNSLRRYDPLHYEDAALRQRVAEARYDLTCVALAQRLAELDGATTPTAVADLVPGYLAVEPKDPFTSSSFTRDATGRFYSIGPDSRDDHGAIAYDPTNGTLSAGDIMLR